MSMNNQPNTNQAPRREASYQSPSTGRWYYINADGIATADTFNPDEEFTGCECEIDWLCPLHTNRGGTFLETRYAGMDEDEARSHGVWAREFGMGVTA